MRFPALALLLAVTSLLAPSASALVRAPVNVFTIVLVGDNAQPYPAWAVASLLPVPGGIQCFGFLTGPSSFEVQCFPAGYRTCLAWQATVTTNGEGGGVVGFATCDGAPPSVAAVIPKQPAGVSVGPVVVGAAPLPLRCGVQWDPTGLGTYQVTCTFVVT